jgi:ubiquinone/menaquinone biosynthesis C-methylase UbiE
MIYPFTAPKYDWPANFNRITLLQKSLQSMNYFEPKTVAERYSQGRPYFHPQVIRRLQTYLALSNPLARAIDVGCGTGLSTVALKEIADHIIGVDNSAQMIAIAPSDSQIEYFVAPAEKLPVKADYFELMTVSSAFHWINRGRFLAEARRVLRSHAWLIVYDNAFFGQMQENKDFGRWFQERYISKYPSPARSQTAFSEEDSEKECFHFVGNENYQNLVTFSIETLVDYLVTQSNIIVTVEGGSEEITNVREWLSENIAPFFRNRMEANFLFGGSIWYLRKAG